jgi:hypothetical protein
VGPLIVALALALVRMYVRDFGPAAVAEAPARREAA